VKVDLLPSALCAGRWAFASKAIFRHLKPNGILAVHISNEYLNLEPVLAATARRLDKAALEVSNDNDLTKAIFAAKWVLLGNRDALAALQPSKNPPHSSLM
jgi:hypothetical protein